jgi:putative salt-induced outer membrane protein YdiY
MLFPRCSVCELLIRAFLLILVISACKEIYGQEVLLHLRTGDLIRGKVVKEDTNAVTLSTTWIKELSIPLAQIEKRELLPSTTNAVVQATTTVTNQPVASATTNALPAVAKASTSGVAVKSARSLPVSTNKPAMTWETWRNRWKGDLSLGASFQSGATDIHLYTAHLGLTYAQPYSSDPKKFFRNVLTYDGQYGRTEGVVSANNMSGSSKTDFDVGKRTYFYNLMGVGYDQITKIDFRYEVGPGMGYHLFTTTNFVMNVELGGNYQADYYTDNTRSLNFYARLAENFTWKINQRMSLVEKFEYFPQINKLDHYRIRFESTFSEALIKNLSLNLSVIDLYDTRPAAGVTQNELQIHSSLGIKF